MMNAVLKIVWEQAVLIFFLEIDIGGGLSCAKVYSNNLLTFGDLVLGLPTVYFKGQSFI